MSIKRKTIDGDLQSGSRDELNCDSYVKLKLEFEQIADQISNQQSELSSKAASNDADFAKMQAIYDELCEHLQSMEALSDQISRSADLETPIPQYSSNTTVDPVSASRLTLDEKRLHSTANAAINQHSLSLLENIDDHRHTTQNTGDGEQRIPEGHAEDESVNRASLVNELKVVPINDVTSDAAATAIESGMVNASIDQPTNPNLPIDQPLTSSLAQEDISHGSFWISVSDTRQWHVREFYPDKTSSPVEPKQQGFCFPDLDALSTSFDEIRLTIDAAGSRSAVLLHGEFGSGKSFYGSSDGESCGLAWALARQGYHVFVVDMHRKQVCYDDSSQRPRALTRLRQRLFPQPSNAVVTEYLPKVMTVCGKRVARRLQRVVAEQTAAISSGIQSDHPFREGLAQSKFVDCGIQQLDEIEHQLSVKVAEIFTPAVWIGHGYSAALLAACWARMDAQENGAQKLVFFGGRRFWREGNMYSKCLSRLLGSRAARALVSLIGKFPARILQLGVEDFDVSCFTQYSSWSSAEQWLDVEDGFDYGQAFAERGTPSTLHVMNESEEGLVSATDVRRFANELRPVSANLIAIPGALKSEIMRSGCHESELPEFSHCGLLTSVAAESWIFQPVLSWLDQQPPPGEACSIESLIQEQANNGKQASANEVNAAELANIRGFALSRS